LSWIRENIHIFWPAAQLGYETVGRGAIVVDTTLRPTGGGHPFGYLDQAAIEQGMPEDTQKLVREYDPSWEFVTALLKSQDRISSYRLGVIPPESREHLDSRVAADPSAEASEAVLEPPDIVTLMEWEAEGGCEAVCPHRCWVEPDGTCPHGKPSWLIVMGLI
jgi:hypothetical protein